MIAIEDKLISEDILEKEFVCNLSSCKGACCVEGDSGAPLEIDETGIIDEIAEKVLPLLTEDGVAAIRKNGAFYLDEETRKFKTQLMTGGACAFVTFDEKGITKCGIEKAHEQGLVDWKKPISCHLYPIRIKKLPDFEALNYEIWDICDAACKLGAELKVPIYQFVKEALIRKYGEEFYEILDAYAKQKEG